MRRVWEDAPKTLDVILQDCSEVDLTCLNYHWPSPFMCGFASMVLWGGQGVPLNHASRYTQTPSQALCHVLYWLDIQLTGGSRCSWPSDGAAVPEVQRCHVASENGGFHCFYHQNDPRYSLDAGEWGLTTGIWGKYPISRQTHKIY